MSDTAADALVQFDGLMPTEVDVLQELVRASGATDALEIGMARATSSLAILAALPSNGTRRQRFQRFPVISTAITHLRSGDRYDRCAMPSKEGL